MTPIARNGKIMTNLNLNLPHFHAFIIPYHTNHTNHFTSMAKPRLILLIRHGESESNCDKSVNTHTPNHKVALTPRGHQQAFEAGVKLRDIVKNNERVCFYTSPYKRTRQTLEGVIKGWGETDTSKFVIREEVRLREQDFGNFQGDGPQQAAMLKERSEYGHFFYRIPHGESAADVHDRCSSFNESLFRQFAKPQFPSVVVLVTHGIWSRVFLQRWFRWSVECFESLCNIPHCSWIIVEQEEEREDHHTHGAGTYTLRTPLQRWGGRPPITDCRDPECYSWINV